MNIPQFANKADLFSYLISNEQKIRDAKFATNKYADVVSFSNLAAQKGENAQKDEVANKEINGETITRLCVINSTNYLDSHGDVHIPGLWKKSLNELKKAYLIKSHKFDFDFVISDEVKAYTKTIPWRELGINDFGNTECLIFEAKIESDDSAGMYSKYFNNKVSQHSVGMRYVKMYLCLNTDNADEAQYKDNWDKYVGQIVNRKEAENLGYFWAVTEAKVLEGSAVLAGSNPITPTLETKTNTIDNDMNTTEDEPDNSTQQTAAVKTFSFDDLLQAIKN